MTHIDRQCGLVRRFSGGISDSATGRITHCEFFQAGVDGGAWTSG